jgi:hypothetical protein
LSQKKRRFACWKCGKPMKTKALACAKCRKTRPRAVKSRLADVAKSYGGKVRPVTVTVTKAARPRSLTKAARGAGPAMPGTAEHWEALAATKYDPEEREACLAEARRIRQACGTENAHAAAQLVKASGSRSLAEAFRKTADPHAQAILLGVLNEGGQRW